MDEGDAELCSEFVESLHDRWRDNLELSDVDSSDYGEPRGRWDE
jgi:hypothetical protein